MDRRDEPKVKGSAKRRALRKALMIAAAVAVLAVLMPSILPHTVSTTHATRAVPVTPTMYANGTERTMQPRTTGQPAAWASDAWKDPSGLGEWESDGGYWYWLEQPPAAASLSAP